MREGSEAPEEGEGTKDDDLEAFRQEVSERGVEGVDGETLDELREGLAHREEQRARTREAEDEGEGAEIKDDSPETGKGPDKEVGEWREALALESGQDEGARQYEPEEQVVDPGEGAKQDAEASDGSGRGKQTEMQTDQAEPWEGQELKYEPVDTEAGGDLVEERSLGTEPTENRSAPEDGSSLQPELGKQSDAEPEAKPAQMETESYTRKDDQLDVTEQGQNRGGPEKVQTESKLETLDLSPLPQSLYPNQRGLTRTPDESESSMNLAKEPATHHEHAENECDSRQFQGSDTSPTSLTDRGREIAYRNQEAILVERPSEKKEDRTSLKDSVEVGNRSETLRASDYGHTSALLVPDRMIPCHTDRSDVFEVRVARVSEPERDYALYTTHKPGYARAYLNLYQLDPKSGERFIVEPGVVYTSNDFAGEYNNAKPPGLDNMLLIKRDGKLFVEVGEKEFPFSESKLRVYQGQAVLEGRVEGIGEVKIAKSLRGFDFRLGDHSRVTGLQSDGGIALTYQRTTHDSYSHRRMISEFPSKSDSPDGPELLRTGKIEVALESEGSPRLFKLIVDEEWSEIVRELLGLARTPDEYRKTKGDLAEEIVRDLVPQLGMTIVKDHPFNNDPLKTRSERTGPDLMIELGNKELGYVEVKWWGNPKDALERGKAQVSSDLYKYPHYSGREVTKGYVAVLDWNPAVDGTFLQLSEVEAHD